MKASPYVRKTKSGLYVYRRAVPESLRSILGPIDGFNLKQDRRELTKGLRTRDQKKAFGLAAEINKRVDEAFERAFEITKASPDKPLALFTQVNPEIVENSISNWAHQIIEEQRQHAFNGSDATSPYFDGIKGQPDGLYHLQQLALNPHLERDRVQHIPNFDALLVSALQSQGISLNINNQTLIANIRPIFSRFWYKATQTINDIRRAPLGVWNIEPLEIKRPSQPEYSNTSLPPRNSNAQLTTNNYPFDHFLEDWKNDRKINGPITERQINIYSNHIRRFAYYLGETTIKDISKKKVRSWYSELVDNKGNPLSLKTKRNHLSGIQNYWKFLIAMEYVDDDHDPFFKLDLPKEGYRQKEKKRDPWAVEEVYTLWQTAKKNEDDQLADLIRIGAYTGARIESIFQIRKKDLIKVERVDMIYIPFDKTAAGTRYIPIHPQLKAQIARMASIVKGQNDYLFQKASNNKYGERSSAAGKRFGRMKKALGFGKRKTFHSFRNTLATLFDHSDVSSQIAGSILGHQNDNITFGHYSSGSSAKQKYDALVKSLPYDDIEFTNSK